jgi:hypothetical protein
MLGRFRSNNNAFPAKIRFVVPPLYRGTALETACIPGVSIGYRVSWGSRVVKPVSLVFRTSSASARLVGVVVARGVRDCIP